MKVLALLPVFLSLMQLSAARGVERVLDVPQIPQVNRDWVKTVKEWNIIPIWSNYQKTKIASGFLGKPVKEITEADLAVPACMVYRKPSTVSAFGQSKAFSIESSGTSMKFLAPNANAQPGEIQFLLTDNASFIFGKVTWKNGDKAWAVLSTDRVFPEYNKELLLNYITESGFDLSSDVWEDIAQCS